MEEAASKEKSGGSSSLLLCVSVHCSLAYSVDVAAAAAAARTVARAAAAATTTPATAATATTAIARDSVAHAADAETRATIRGDVTHGVHAAYCLHPAAGLAHRAERPSLLGRRQIRAALRTEKRPFFPLNFLCVCPEPVLAK